MSSYEICVEGVQHLNCIMTTIYCNHPTPLKPSRSVTWGLYTEVGAVVASLPHIICYFQKTINGMIHYILQVSNAKPTQFRIVVTEAPGGDTFKSLDDPGFVSIGIYETPDALMQVIEPYLRLEDGK